MDKKYAALLLPMRSLVFALVFVLASLITGKALADISNIWSAADSIINILTILLLIFFAKKCGKSYGGLINYEKGKTKPKEVILVSIMILLVGMAGMYLAGFICYGVIPYAAPMMIAPIAKPLAIINAFVLPISTAFAEDGLYLGAGVGSIKNKYAAVIFPAFFFALQHSFIPTLFDARYMLYRFLSFLPLTVILCICYYKKRNLVPILIGHAIIDVATVMQIIATSFIPGFYDMMCGL